MTFQNTDNELKLDRPAAYNRICAALRMYTVCTRPIHHVYDRITASWVRAHLEQHCFSVTWCITECLIDCYLAHHRTINTRRFIDSRGFDRVNLKQHRFLLGHAVDTQFSLMENPAGGAISNHNILHYSPSITLESTTLLLLIINTIYSTEY